MFISSGRLESLLHLQNNIRAGLAILGGFLFAAINYVVLVFVMLWFTIGVMDWSL